MPNYATSLFHFGKTQQIGEQVVNNFGLDARETHELLDALRCDFSNRLQQTGVAITDSISERISQIIEDKFIEIVCKFHEGRSATEERVIQAVRQNFYILQENSAAFVSSLKTQFDNLKEKTLSLEENLTNFCNQMAWQSQEVFGALFEIVSPMKNIKWDFSRELQEGWVCLKKADFTHAKELFQRAANQNSATAEAYFGLALAECQVSILWDYVNCHEQPLCYDYNVDISENAHYRLALQYATEPQKAQFEDFREEIELIQKEFEALERSGLDYDCFICVKIKEENGACTEDSKDATNIYKALDRKKHKPFYSDFEIRNKAGGQYEAHILYALYKSKCMLLVCRKKEYLETPWVKNEYLRFLKMMDDGEKNRGSLAIVFFGNKIERLPGRKGRIEGIDFSDRASLFDIVEFVDQQTRSDSDKQGSRAAKRQEEGAKEEEPKAAQTTGKGHEVPRTHLDFVRQGAERGNAEHQLFLGVCYENGRGVEKDPVQAVSWYQKAAKQGHAKAQYNLGVCYEYGRGVKQDDVQAVAWYRKAAEQGHVDAQYELGCCYESGQGIEKDLAKAVAWYRKAAEQGYVKAQYKLGFCYYCGRGVKQDDVQAAAWFRKATEQDYSEAQFGLGFCYENGQGVKQDDAQAVAWYGKAAEQGYVEAQYKLGLCYEYGRGVEKDPVQAVSWYQKAAEQGDVDAQYKLGLCYEDGFGVEEDDEQAVAWYQKAAEKGYAKAQYKLGLCYEDGRGVEKNLAKAAEWYQKAAEQGDADAQYKLGLCYRFGRGVEQDDAQAVAWYQKAAEQGHAKAQNALGWRYEKGRGVKKDLVQAVAWYQKAAEQGDARAQCNLGVCYEKGRGVKKDPVQAVAWYREAAKQGHAKAQYILGLCYYCGHGVKQDDVRAVVWYREAAKKGLAEAQCYLGICYYCGRGVEKDDVQAIEWYKKAAEQKYLPAINKLKELKVIY